MQEGRGWQEQQMTTVVRVQPFNGGWQVEVDGRTLLFSTLPAVVKWYRSSFNVSQLPSGSSTVNSS